MNAPLEVDSLVAGAGREPVLRGLTLRLAAGERAALFGASGSGKSTLLRAIAGFVTPRSGTIRIGGRRVADATTSVAPSRRGVAMVFQSYALWPHLTAQEQVRLVAGDDVRARQWLERARLGHRADHLPGQLSGGEQARLALARAFAGRASLLLLDEPLRNLDPPLAAELRLDLVSWLAESGAAALLVTHEPADALAMTTTLHALVDGQVAASGPPREMLEAPKSAAVARLFGVATRAPEGATAAATSAAGAASGAAG
jgi:ABC-type Fe3+/spermidine/putrescine transport system ATPase subunit